MSTPCLTIKLRFFTLVVTTGNLINERSTKTLGMTHAILSPISLFTTYVFIFVMIVGVVRKQPATVFLQTYALIICCILQSSLAITVFSELSARPLHHRSTGMTLNALLPMFIIIMHLTDLILTLFSSRQTTELELPSRTNSQLL